MTTKKRVCLCLIMNILVCKNAFFGKIEIIHTRNTPFPILGRKTESDAFNLPV